jgi:phage recombination protein Bet
MTDVQHDRRVDFTDAQLKLIRRSVARMCTAAEFDEFMAVASQCGLDPLRRQIAPLILSPDDADRRRLIPWTTIDGLRVIAARHKDYRPMEAPPVIEYEPSLVDEMKNPLGIVRAEVRAWKLADNEWHAVAGEAWWEEFAPLRQAYFPPSCDQADARHQKDGSGAVLEESWRRMGRVMIAKCAEAQALRRGWPDLLSGLYGEEELAGFRLSQRTASELMRQSEEEVVRQRRAMRTLWFVAAPGARFQPVRVNDVREFVSAIYLSAKSVAEIKRFEEDNRASLATYWDWMPQEAFDLKAMSESLQSAIDRSVSERENLAPANEARDAAHELSPRDLGATVETRFE